MTVMIGLEVGWSGKRRTWGLAISGAKLSGLRAVELGWVSAAALSFDEAVRALKGLLGEGDGRVFLVANGPLGRGRTPTQRRVVDGATRTGLFAGRAQPMTAIEAPSQRAAEALFDLLDEAAGKGNWAPWFGDGPIPQAGIIVAETNVTTALALALPPLPVEKLPSRARPLRRAKAPLLRSKAEHYWLAGGNRIAAEILDEKLLVGERDTTRSAALWCLALAQAVLCGDGALLGDGDGVCAVGPIHPDWAEEIARVGVHAGKAHLVPSKATSVSGTPVELHVVEPHTTVNLDADADDGADRGDGVWTIFSENGTISSVLNPWIAELSGRQTVKLFGLTTVTATLDPVPGNPENPDERVFSMQPAPSYVEGIWAVGKRARRNLLAVATELV
jgi:hypothetical protein